MAVDLYRRKFRLQAISKLGGRCVTCGIDDWHFLALDHIDAGGLAHRKQINWCSRKVFIEVCESVEAYLKYQVLCFNCNFIKSDKLKDGLSKRDPNLIEVSSTAGRRCLWCSKIAFKGGLCLSCYEHNKLQVRRQSLRLKQAIVEGYGGKCNCCGYSENIYALVIDHIFNDRKEEIKKFKGSTHTFYRYLRDASYPKDRYQLLCMNCNMGKQLYNGVCPHVIGVPNHVNYS